MFKQMFSWKTSPSIGSKRKNLLGKPHEDVKKHYTLGKELGKGDTGVIVAAKSKATGEDVAVKCIPKTGHTSIDDLDLIKNEVEIVTSLSGHGDIIEVKGVYEDKDKIHVVQELCEGGELFDMIVEVGKYSEASAAKLMKSILGAVAQCHANDVIHRDLKPENFLFAKKSPGSALKLIDFGMATHCKDGQKLKEIVGSPMYIAPEVLKGHYGKEADLWSCGVILYILLAGHPPFSGDTEKQIYNAVLRGKADFSSLPWPSISPAAQELTKALLTLDASKRPTAEQALRHRWFTAPAETDIGGGVIGRLKAFTGSNKMKKLALTVIACSLPRKEIDGLRKMFKEMDKDKSGTITFDELKAGMRKLGNKMPEEQLRVIMNAADVDGSGKIDYTEFLAATVAMNNIAKEEQIRAAFMHFDKDNSGAITVEELREALASEHMLEAGEVEKIIAEVDADGNGIIDFDEFAAMMRAQNAADEVQEEGVPKVKKGRRG